MINGNENEAEIKNISQGYDTNRPRVRHGHKKTICEMCLIIMMVICMKQHLSNIWSSIHEKVKQQWDGVEKNAVYKKKRAYALQNWWIVY